MKIWEVELKNKKLERSVKNHIEARITDTMHIAADDYDLAARNALEQITFYNVIVTSVRLIAETKEAV